MCKGRETTTNCGARCAITVQTASQGLTPQLFWKHRVGLLACSREELDAVVVKLVAAARETEQTAPAPDGDGLDDGAWSTPPTPVLKVGGRVLLCNPADLPRQIERAGVLGTIEPDSDEETVIIVVHAPSNAASHPADADDKTQPKEPRSHDGRPGADAAARGGGTSRVLRMNLPLGRRTQHVFVHEVLPRAVSFASSHFSLGRKICVAGGDEGIGVALVLLQLFFDDEGSLVCSDNMPSGAAAGKSSVRTRLEWIIASRPQVNPSRTILKRVNDFLFSPLTHRQDGVE